MTLFAVYGTLRLGERNHGLLQGAPMLGVGSLRGTLYDVPRGPIRSYAYPALVVPGIDDVRVEIYRVPGQLVGTLDVLEAYDPADKAGSQYLRIPLPVDDGPVQRAYAYVYNGAPDDLGMRIASGDWVSYDAARP